MKRGRKQSNEGGAQIGINNNDAWMAKHRPLGLEPLFSSTPTEKQGYRQVYYYAWRDMSRTTGANLECVFVINQLVFIDAIA